MDYDELKCEVCGKNGEWCLDPYIEDVEGKEVERILCHECYNEIAMDI